MPSILCLALKNGYTILNTHSLIVHGLVEDTDTKPDHFSVIEWVEVVGKLRRRERTVSLDRAERSQVTLSRSEGTSLRHEK